MDKIKPKVIIGGSYVPLDISSESITIPAGASGSVVDFYISKKPIADSNKSYIGGDGDTSITFTSTAFTNEVANFTKDANMSNGDYWIDYVKGVGRGKKADGSTSGTMDYTIFTS